MNALRKFLKIAPVLLALACLATPVTSRAEDPVPEKKLSKAREKYDTDKDGKLSDDEKAVAKEDAKTRREERKQNALAKYDANGNGKLDKDERARMNADEDEARAARKAEREANKAAKAAKRAEREAKKSAKDAAKD